MYNGPVIYLFMKEDLFPHPNFPIRLEYDENDDKKICWFQCFDHFQKHMTRYNINPNNSKIDIDPKVDIDIKKISKNQKGKDYKTKKLFSNLETFFNGKGSKRKTKTNSKKSQTPS